MEGTSGGQARAERDPYRDVGSDGSPFDDLHVLHTHGKVVRQEKVVKLRRLPHVPERAPGVEGGHQRYVGLGGEACVGHNFGRRLPVAAHDTGNMLTLSPDACPDRFHVAEVDGSHALPVLQVSADHGAPPKAGWFNARGNDSRRRDFDGAVHRRAQPDVRPSKDGDPRAPAPPNPWLGGQE